MDAFDRTARHPSCSRCNLDARLLPPDPEGPGAGIAVLELGEVARHMLRRDRAVGPGDRGLDVAERGVDPTEGRCARCSRARAGPDDPVPAPGLGDSGEAAEAVADHLAGEIQAALGEALDSTAAEAVTRRSFSRTGLPSGVVSTAARKGVLPGEPRPRLPPERSPPR